MGKVNRWGEGLADRRGCREPGQVEARHRCGSAGGSPRARGKSNRVSETQSRR